MRPRLGRWLRTGAAAASLTSLVLPACVLGVMAGIGTTGSIALGKGADQVGATDPVLELGAATGTVRFLGDLDGFLTEPSTKSPERVTLDYVKDHHAMLGLAAADLTTFRLRRDYRDIAGIHHLYFTQRVAGRRPSGRGLVAAVTASGRLLMLGGTPYSTATTRGLRPASSLPSAAGVAPATPAPPRLAARGRHSIGLAFQLFPGAPRGGTQVRVDFTAHGWLGPDATTLRGNNAHAYTDVDDDERASASEEVRPSRPGSWDYRLHAFHPGFADSFCGKPWPCTWNPDVPGSWRVNRAQATTQAFFFVNTFHDHLLAPPIGFTEAAGNFQVRNRTGQGKGGDPVIVQTEDGADTGRGNRRGLPDSDHVDDSDMSTPPDGQSPTMQLMLQHQPFTDYPDGDPWSPTDTAQEADTVYHEYTHGLSNRLVVDVRGHNTLGEAQGDAMGEAWSDWYALDYLVAHGLDRDRPGSVDLRLSVYDGAGADEDRTEAMDCQVSQPDPLCRGGRTGHRGGYTYGDYGHVISHPEVHADGEIWAQTLWDLRTELGSARSESLVTRAMELAPFDPSYVDMRNAVLLADTAVTGGAEHAVIWEVFARRGLGFYAGSLTGSDGHPSASFALPPQQERSGVIEGSVVDARSGAPVEGATVMLAFEGSGTANPSAITDSAGHYVITGVPQGHYGKLVVRGAGHQGRRRSVTVGSDRTTVDLATPRVAPGH